MLFNFRNLPRPLKRKHVEETVSDIPEVLQGEVARLDQRFKVVTAYVMYIYLVQYCAVSKTKSVLILFIH